MPVYSPSHRFAQNTATAAKLKTQSPIDSASLKKITTPSPSQPSDFVTTVDNMSLVELAGKTFDATKPPSKENIDAAQALQTEIAQIQETHTKAASELAEQMQKEIELQLLASDARNVLQSVEIAKRIVDKVTTAYQKKFDDLNANTSKEIQTHINKYDAILDIEKTLANQKNSAQACDAATKEALLAAKEQAFNSLLKDQATHVKEASADYLINIQKAQSVSPAPNNNSAKTGLAPAQKIATGTRLITKDGALITTTANSTFCRFKQKVGRFSVKTDYTRDTIRTQLLHNKAISDKPDLTITINVGDPNSKPNQELANNIARAYYEEALKMGYKEHEINFRSDRQNLSFTDLAYKQHSTWLPERIQAHEQSQQAITDKILQDISDNISPIINAGETLAANTSKLVVDTNNPNIDPNDLITSVEKLHIDITKQLDAIEKLATSDEMGSGRAKALHQELNSTYDSLEKTKAAIDKAIPTADPNKIKDLNDVYKAQKERIDKLGSTLHDHHKNPNLLAYKQDKTENTDAPRAHALH